MHLQNFVFALALHILALLPAFAADPPKEIAPLFAPPGEFKNDFGKYRSLLVFTDGSPVRSAVDWQKRRAEIRSEWEREIGRWPELIAQPKLEYLSTTNRESFKQHRVRVEVAPGAVQEGYLLVPSGRGPFPAVVVPYYEPESSIGVGKVQLRDFGYQLTRRGFVSLSIGSPGGDALNPDISRVLIQPLHYLGYIAANCYNALANLPQVDPKRIAVVGHSYGGKWAMFAACFHDKFAAGAWSDPGIVFDEGRPNVNYWEPWYLGLETTPTPTHNATPLRKPGLPTAENPRTGPYKRLFESGRDLHEFQALMAPRPFLVSGGAEDQPARWQPLNRINEVYALLGATNRVAMSNRPHHDPTPESNEQIYKFLEHFLGSSSDQR
jgi:hypothetical protein